jgi:nitrate reductase gamma subunit
MPLSPTTIVFAALFYFAAAVFAIGVAWKILGYAKTPAPLKIATTPAPITRAGVAWRLAREVAFFESLFKSSKWTWLFGWAFHAALLLVLLRHLRYFQEPVWLPVVLVQPFGTYAGFAMVAALAGLWARRWLVDRVRYISTPSDHLMLALLIAIGLTGLGMRFVAHTDIVALKMFMLGLLRFDLQPLPSDPVLLVHLSLVALLTIIFPISKLLHAPGLFFSPTRNQPDNAREVRHISAWSAALDPKA